MIIDRQNLFSYKQAITTNANSSDTIDLGPNMWAGNSGNDSELPIFVNVDQAFTAAGAATLQIIIESSNSETFASGVQIESQTGAIALADLATAKRYPAGLVLTTACKRYVRARYVIATGPMTAGQITVGLTASRQTNF